MDPRRAETYVLPRNFTRRAHSQPITRLEALSTYLQHQKTLLARTQADIERLKRLRADALASSEQFANRSNFQVALFPCLLRRSSLNLHRRTMHNR